MKMLKNIGIAIVCLCVLAYSVFHVSSLFSEEIGTIVVGPTTEKTTTTLNGYVFRDATLVYPTTYSGTVDYLVKNGEKVSVGSNLATVYSQGSSVSAKDTLAMLDEQIALLESTTAQKPSVSELTELRKTASDTYYSIMKQLQSGTDIALSAQQKKLLVALNSIAILDVEGFSIEQTLASLKASRAEIIGAGGESETVSTTKSGYFYTSVDGYEEAFSGRAALELDREGFLELFASPKLSSVSGSIGKMSYDSSWYFAAELDKKTAEKFAVGEVYTVEFTSGGYFEVRMTVERILVGAEKERAVMVLSSNNLPENFNFRQQTARIVTDSVSGIYIPESAVYRNSYGEEIVYILEGSVVQLRYIDVIYKGSDYYIARENVDKNDGRNYLTSNEQLIVKGSNLFDGRILG